MAMYFNLPLINTLTLFIAQFHTYLKTYITIRKNIAKKLTLARLPGLFPGGKVAGAWS
jgi:hypothetical protein